MFFDPAEQARHIRDLRQEYAHLHISMYRHRCGERPSAQADIMRGHYIEAYLDAASGTVNKLQSCMTGATKLAQEEKSAVLQGITVATSHAITTTGKFNAPYSLLRYEAVSERLSDEGYNALVQGIGEGYDQLLSSRPIKISHVERFLCAANHTNAQVPYVGSVLKQAWIHAAVDAAQVRAGRAKDIIDSLQLPKVKDGLQAMLKKSGLVLHMSG